jgi:DNA-directed RNA polymerase subunit RPC12/RpoP
MSLRRLYSSIPLDRRLCSYYRCQKPILRNIDRDRSGHIYHHGCLMAAQDEQYRCLECYLTFDATEAAFDLCQSSFNDEFREKLTVVCPSCGSRNRSIDR